MEAGNIRKDCGNFEVRIQIKCKAEEKWCQQGTEYSYKGGKTIWRLSAFSKTGPQSKVN